MIYYFVFKLYSSHSLTPYYHQAPNHHQFSMLIHYFLITFYVIFRNSWQTIIHGPLHEGEATRLAELGLISITYFTYIFKTSSLFFSIPFSGGFFIFEID